MCECEWRSILARIKLVSVTSLSFLYRVVERVVVAAVDTSPPSGPRMCYCGASITEMNDVVRVR